MKKMMKCKTCGAEIAKSASRCPQCGAKQHQGVLIASSLIIVFMFVGIIAIALGGSNSAANVSASSKPAPITIAANDLWKTYSENKVNADNKYKGKTLAVTGVVSDITKDVISGNPCVSLKVDAQYNLYPIQCFFPASDKQSEKLAALRNGQTVTIVGTCSGAPIAHVQLSGCSLG